MLLESVKSKKFFIFLIVVASFYIAFIKTHFYRSESSVIVKSLDNQSTTASFLGLIDTMPTTNSTDAFVIREYLSSYEMYNKVNERFKLSELYNSFSLDFLQRLYPFSDYEDYIKTYNKHLSVYYDTTSNIIKIAFLHTNSEISKQIVEFLVKQMQDKLNEYNQQIAQKKLFFIQNETQKNKNMLDSAVLNLKAYQDSNTMIDPNANISTNESILATLKNQLVEKEALLGKISEYLTNNSFEIIDLKREINKIKGTIRKIQNEQLGNDGISLNKNVFEFKNLKTQVELYTELYKQSLLQLQSLMVEINKEGKILQVIVNANVPVSYYEPQKLREIVTVVVILLLVYGVGFLTNAIIKDHNEG